MIVIEPQEAYAARHTYGPTATGAPLRGVQHPLAPAVMNAMHKYGQTPVGLWRVINGLAAAQKKDDRGQHRFWRLRFWVACRELLRVKLLFRHRGWIATSPIAYRPKPRPARRLTSSAPRTDTKIAGSNATTTLAETAPKSAQPLKPKLLAGSQSMVVAPTKTKSARPPEEVVSAAASLVAMRPRPRQRKWTGILHGERLRRRTPVRVPGGAVLPAYTILRGKVFVLAPEESWRIVDRYDESEVVRVKNPAAVLLGSLKAGVKERPSARKQAAARANGRQPCHPGRRRGRPCGHHGKHFIHL